MSKVGICGGLLKWFYDYLFNRQQRVVINGQASEWLPIKAGVPQGSVLGPLLFLVFINDLTFHVQSTEVRLFADDTILYVLADHPVDGVDNLNSDLQNIQRWADRWLVKFSPPKTKSMTLKKKSKEDQPPPALIFGNSVVEEVTSHKHLGVTLSNDLSWRLHIDNIVSNAGKCLDVLNALKHILDRSTLERVYQSFVRSKLEYASIVWDNCTNEQRNQLEQVQYRAGKIVSGAINRTSKDLVYQELGWHSLDERRQVQRLKVFHKMFYGKAPLYLQNEIPIPNPSRDNLRNNDDIPKIRGLVIYQNTFIPKTICDWNDLEDEVKSTESNESFAKRITRDIDIPIWYSRGDRQSNIWHARLRMKCSKLNDDLFSHIHVVEAPTCSCGFRRETAKHFLLDCPLYNNDRAVMLSDLNEIGFKATTKNVLFGNTSYSNDLNCQAVDIIQTYFRATKRFE